jgi:hypothetical protein
VLDLPDGVRVLAWSSLVGGGWAVAVPEGLRAVLPTGRFVDRPWTEVDHVAWDDESRMLAVRWVGGRPATPLEVAEGSFLPEVVHERVRASVVLSLDVDVPGGATVRVALRKAADGTLSTQAIPGRGAGLTDPEVAAVVERARAQLRDEAGLPPGT